MAALQGKVAVITGCSSGIGLAAAKRFAAEGAFVFITGRQQAELDKAVKEIGRNVVAVRSDVSNLGDLDQLYKEVAAKKGKIDILFANAGIVETVETSAVTPEHFDRTFNIKCAWRVLHRPKMSGLGQPSLGARESARTSSAQDRLKRPFLTASSQRKKPPML